MLAFTVATQAELDAEAATRAAADAAEVINRNAAIAATNPTQRLTSAASQATTSGTSKDFTSIPSWVKRITVLFQGVSLSGTAGFLVQVGAGSVATTGYVSTGVRTSTASTSNGLNSTAGMVVGNNVATDTVSGTMTFSHMGGNVWVSSHTMKGATNTGFHGGGDVTLGGVLDRLRVTTTNGTDTFDAGSVNILYE